VCFLFSLSERRSLSAPLLSFEFDGLNEFIIRHHDLHLSSTFHVLL
jgi:hypothetical protein